MISLENNPSQHYSEFVAAVDAFSATQCPEFFPNRGLAELYVAHTPTQYARLGLTDIDPQTNAAIPRPQPPLPTAPLNLPNAAGAGAIQTRKEALELYRNVASGISTVRDYVLLCCGETIRLELNDLLGGLSSQTLPQILLYLETTYGVLSEQDYRNITGSLHNKFSTPASFRSEVAKMQSSFKTLADNNQPIAEILKMQYLESACELMPAITAVIARYKEAHEAVSTRTLTGMAQYVMRHAPLTTANLGYANATTNIPFTVTGATVPSYYPGSTSVAAPPTIADNNSTAILHALAPLLAPFLTTHFAGLAHNTTPNPNNRGGRGGRSGRTNTSGRGGRGGAPQPEQRRKKSYCFVHGYQHSHAGPQCKTMINDSSYTEAMKAAIAPGIIDGYQGNT